MSDWHLFKIEYCTCTPGMLGRSRERQILTLSRERQILTLSDQ